MRILAMVWLAAGAAWAVENKEFDSLVKPYLARNCVSCHGAQVSMKNVRLDGLEAGSEAKLWQAVWKQISIGAMPPKGAAQPDKAQTGQVARWIQQRLNAVGGVNPVEQPGFGNYVEHAALFREPAVRRAASPQRIWRITPYIFRDTVNRLSQRPVLRVFANQGGDGMHPSLPFLTPAHVFRDYSVSHGFEDATTELMMDMALRVAAYQMEGKKSALPAEYEAAIRAQYDLVLQRSPKQEELERLLALAARTEKESGRRNAMQTVLAAVLLTPEAVFRFEVGEGKPDRLGRVRLAGSEIALAVSFALTDKLPDERLRAAARAGKLATREGVMDEVRRMLDDGAVSKPRTLRFFQEYFEYFRAPEVFKSHKLIKHINAQQMVMDADSLVMHVLNEDRDVLRQLLTTDRLYVNYAPPGKPSVTRPDQRQKWYYDIFNLGREWTFQAQQPLAFPGQRSGMLTHPAWLLTFSDNENNQAIQRGRWVQMKLLGGTVPDVPIDVNAQLPEDAKLTLRERMQVTRQTYCWTCHQKMDRLGLPFEQFDDFGQHRTVEKNRPVDASGSVDVGIAEVDGPVKDPFELVARLAKSRHVQQVFVRHAFRYWMGRNETLEDAPTMIDAEKAYMAAGGSMKALIASLLTSDSFLYRRMPVVETARKTP